MSMEIPRAFSSGSRSVSTPVNARTSAVLPWSMCPAVPSVCAILDRMPSFDEVARAIAGIPFMSPAQGRLVYAHVRDSGARDVLELGTAHGVGAAYMAAAGAHVTTVDFAGARYDPSPEEIVARAGVADRVTIVREFSSYTWWL